LKLDENFAIIAHTKMIYHDATVFVRIKFDIYIQIKQLF